MAHIIPQLAPGSNPTLALPGKGATLRSVRVGAHESTAGGLYQALLRGEADGCEAVQIFTGFNTRWAPRPLADEEASAFLSTAAGLGWPVLSHGCYLVNLASPDPALWRRSVAALVQELRRCETLAIPHVVLHPGSHVDDFTCDIRPENRVFRPPEPCTDGTHKNRFPAHERPV